MWDHFLDQTYLTLNLIFQATLNPHILAWEYFNDAFNYAATSFVPIRRKIFIHTKSKICKYWDQRGCKGFSIGPALQKYRFIQAIERKTKALLSTDKAEYLHDYLTQQSITEEERMMHTIHFLYAALKYLPNSICNSQLAATEAVCEIFSKWRTVEPFPPVYPTAVPPPLSCDYSRSE